MKIAPGSFHLNYKGKPLTGVEAVIPRIGASVTRYGTAVLRQFEMMGAYTPNTSDAILRARDKLRCHQLLAGQGIGLPATVFGDNPDDTDDLLRLLGKPPHVIKLIEGSQGNGVVLAERLSASRSVIEAFRGLYANFLVQEFIAEAGGADIRCFVVGDQVVAAMMVLRVMPLSSAALTGVVCSAPSNTRNRFSPAPSLSSPVEASAMPSPKPRRRASRAISVPDR